MIAQTFLEQNQPADSAVAVLKRMDTFKPIAKIKQIVKAFFVPAVITGKELFHLRRNFLRRSRHLSADLMIDLSNIKNYYIACGYTDLRRGIDGLAQIITLQYGYEIDENSLFLFCGRRTDRIKALWFSGDGFVLLYKRLNNGSFQWPRSKDELKLLTPQSFR